MTDHFKDNHDSNGEPTKSFKEQILAELRDAHRLRRMREKEFLAPEGHDDANHDIDVIETVLSSESSFDEDDKNRLLSQLKEVHRVNQLSETGSVVELDSEEVKIQLEDDSYSVSSATTELVSSNFIPLNDDWSEHSHPVDGQLSFDLEDTIPLEPISDGSLVSETEEILSFEQSDSSEERDLSVTGVMASFKQLFEPEKRDTVEESDLANDIPPTNPDSDQVALEETQVFDTQDFVVSDFNENNLEEDRGYRHQRTNRVAKKISLGLLSVLTILILATGFFVYRYIDSGIKPLDAKSTDYVQVEIPSGSGNKLIGKILEDSGVIKSGQIFNYYVKFKNYTDFKSGYYNFQKSMSLDEIAQKLQEGGTDVPERPALGKVLIPEGYTLEQIAKSVTANANTVDKKDKTPFSEADFMTLVQDENFIAKMTEKFPNLLANLPSAADVRYRLEGYLFPATYSYYEETSLEGLVEQMLAAMDANLSPFYTSIANSGMTVNQILTLASLVEKEGATDDDRKLIAGVFYNRWNQGMPLQSNIAILYAMGKLGQATTLLEDATIDTGINSPYNIYVNPGLMPGPVDSPSLSAIKATINPEQSNYLYFVADVTTGAVYYAEDYDEHSANVEKYINSQLAKNN